MLFLIPVFSGACFASDLNVWFDSPAKEWEETLPLGNGRIGFMPDGGVEKETLVLNDITLWSGGIQDADNPEAARYLPEIRRLLFEGKNDQAQDLVYKTFVCKGQGSGHGRGAGVPYGSFEILGNLHIDYQYPSGMAKPEKYRRYLSLNDAIAYTSFVSEGVTYTREYFAAFGRDVLVIRLHSSGKGALNFKVGIDRPQAFETLVDGNGLLMKGQLNNGTDGKGMRYNARVHVKLAGKGNLAVRDRQIEVSDAGEAYIFISMNTDYKNPEFEQKCLSLLQQALSFQYKDMKAEHQKSYRRYFDRMHLNLKHHSGRDTIPTDRRLLAFASNPEDNGLVELYFQFGRYLLISSTRPGLLPPNLQGLWANTIDTPWNGDYHLNINVQMNHWPVEVTNLPELHQPLIQLTEGLVKPGSATAKAFYNADNGWVAHMMTNVWGFTAPGEHPSWGATNTGGTWLCAHLWEHYDFNRDKAYLQSIYPVLKGSAEFFLDILVPEPKHGWLVTAPTTSPENSFYMPGTQKAVNICMGSTMDNQLVREIFGNVITAGEILGVDKDLRDKLKEATDKLPPNRIGSDGRLMEWLEEYKETEPHHRHVSHLYGLHPGNQITLKGTPELAEAARKSLEFRGDGGTGWSRAWKINFWARLGEGNHAYLLLRNLLTPVFDKGFNMNTGGTYANLFCGHSPFQIDGNFGGCAGIAEMFLQSHSGIIELLPALPDVMPDGSFDGMRVRGGAEISATWKDGKVKSAVLRATADNTFKLRIPDGSGAEFKKDKRAVNPEIMNNIVNISLKSGESLRINMVYSH
ncbi:alpha/beta hydrolase [Bacteroidia bacterium]|nr:alpha/beta hydrolase [Bacteroidia bacterium]